MSRSYLFEMVVAKGRYVLTSIVSGDTKSSRERKFLPCAIFEPEVKHLQGQLIEQKANLPTKLQGHHLLNGSSYHSAPWVQGSFDPMPGRASKLSYESKESLRCPADVLD